MVKKKIWRWRLNFVAEKRRNGFNNSTSRENFWHSMQNVILINLANVPLFIKVTNSIGTLIQHNWPYILKPGFPGFQKPQAIWIFRRKIVWERENKQFFSMIFIDFYWFFYFYWFLLIFIDFYWFLLIFYWIFIDF